MNKKILLIGLLLLILPLHAKADERPGHGLKGNVKSCFERTYQAEEYDGEWEAVLLEHRGHYSLFEFDENGLLERKEDYVYERTPTFYPDIHKMADNTIFTRINREIPVRVDGRIKEIKIYDNEGELTGTRVLSYVSDEETAFTWYDENGKKEIRGKYIYRNNLCVKHIYTLRGDTVAISWEYDDNGNKISFQVATDGNISSEGRYEYLKFDSEGNYTEMLGYTTDGIFITKRDIEYY